MIFTWAQPGATGVTPRTFLLSQAVGPPDQPWQKDLDELRVDSLVLTGCLTEIGLMATATDALQQGGFALVRAGEIYSPDAGKSQ